MNIGAILKYVFSRNACLYHLTASLYFFFFMAGRVKIIGIENVPKNPKGVIFVANHVRDSDPWRVSIPLFFRCYIHWLAKKELYDSKTAVTAALKKKMPRILTFILSHLTALLVNHSSTIKVDSMGVDKPMNIAAMKKAVSILRAGGCVGVFPFPGQNREIADAKGGAWFLARRSGGTIIPVQIRGKEVEYFPPITAENVDGPQILQRITASL